MPRGIVGQSQQRDEHEGESQAIDHERGHDADARDQDAGDGRADDARGVVRRRVERDGVHEVLRPTSRITSDCRAGASSA